MARRGDRPVAPTISIWVIRSAPCCLRVGSAFRISLIQISAFHSAIRPALRSAAQPQSKRRGNPPAWAGLPILRAATGGRPYISKKS